MGERDFPRDNEIERGLPRLPKKLVVCCDGTWQDSDNGWIKGSWGKPGRMQTPSNVTQISRAITPEDSAHHPQIVYYQNGIGTGIGLYDHFVGGAIGVGLSENIREAYAFVASNYSPRDEITDADSIFLVGFSRGAYTARSLGGFIAAVGILTKKALPYFYECFLDWENAGSPDYKPKLWDAYVKDYPDDAESVRRLEPALKLAKVPGDAGIDTYMAAYRKALTALGLTNIADIQCIGVWDTVGSLGIPVNPILQRIFGLPGYLKEYRWFDTRVDDRVLNAFQALAIDEARWPFSPSVWEQRENGTTKLKQCWFPGGHTNVGGGFADAGTSNVTLAWMMDQLSGKTQPDPSSLDPKDWITFDPNYINECWKQNQQFYDRQRNRGQAYRDWGMGKLFNTDTFPLSILGRATRRPGMYHQTDYNTGQYTSQLLRNTHEHIHASVRARIDLGGRTIEPEQFWQYVTRFFWRLVSFQKLFGTRPYHPEGNGGFLIRPGPLSEWKLADGHASHAKPNDNIDVVKPADLDAVLWQYYGRKRVASNVLPEDIMAVDGFEAMLLAHDAALDRELLFSNHGWKQFVKPKVTPARAATR